ncbi:hypothetical protein PV325_004092 [Microctonus aethiopoides]|nr:hypothetical protein PV325_004092 [Microctonus aethiopoides]
MMNISSICYWAGMNLKQRNFVEGERIFKASHIIKSGKNKDKNSRSNTVSFTAYRLKTSKLMVQLNGEIISVQCSCKAGLGEQCKHIIATLFYCNRNDISQTEELSCIDKACVWKKSFQDILGNYAPQQLLEHNTRIYVEAKNNLE